MSRHLSNRTHRFIAVRHLVVIVAFPFSNLAIASSPADIFFTKKVEPVLINRCLECHGDKKEGELDLRTRATALLGGESGVVIIPGNFAASKLFNQVYNEKMPPKHPLNDEEVEVLEQWITEGLYYPEKSLTQLAVKSSWWSQLPLHQPELPFPGSNDIQPIDQYIFSRHAEKKLTPSSPADPKTLIRRVTFDLHGLPPSPDEFDSFIAECKEETQSTERVGDAAYSKLIDRLLASPRYGERWARHWLDIVHFGETHGFDKDQRRDNAWPYRDYVIQSFNEDKPYSTFATEQLAGDALTVGQPDGVIATGFLAAGPWDFVGQIEVREGTIEKKRVRNLDRDDIVSNVFNTFQSTTVQCARCHNHKFDSILRADYYRIQSVFSGIDRSDRMYESMEVSERRDALAQKIVTAKKELEETKKVLLLSLPEKYTQAQKNIDRLKRKRTSLQPEKAQAASPSNGYHSVIASTPNESQWLEIDLGSSISLNVIKLIPARPTDYKDTPGFGFPVRFTVSVSSTDDVNDFQEIADHSVSDYPNPGVAPVIYDLIDEKVRRIRIEAHVLWERDKDYAFALAEVEAISKGNNVARSATISASTSLDFGRWNSRFLIDGYDSRKPLLGSENIKSAKLLKVEAEIEEANALREKLIKRHVKKSVLRSKAMQEEALNIIRKHVDELPKPNSVYSIRSIAPRPVYDLPRGNEATPAELVAPAALTLISDLDSKLTVDSDNEANTRLALAQWVTNEKNSLTWRSIVNRIWQYHFGKGIVDTPNDFGRAGSLPTHPKLLDWLAAEFRKTGSIKTLHRVILASATYRQSSQYNISNDSIDGSNQFLWRMNPRKLDAESIHDSILAVSGKLDLTMGGPSYEAFNYTHDHSPRYDFLGKDSPDVWRRSIYRFIVRSVPDPLFEALDCADPSMNTPVRNETLTAPQALVMLNDAFILKQSEYTATRLRVLESDKQAEIIQLYRLALSRTPESDELATLIEFAEQHGMPSLVRLIFNLNEFMFVD